MIGSANRLAWAAFGLGALGCAAAAVVDARALLAVYLPVAVTVIAIPSGCLAVLMMSYLVRGAWTEDFHRPLTIAALTTPLAGLLLVPVLVAIPWLYPWATAGTHSSFQASYLTPAFFIARSIFYVGLWSLLALWMHQVYGDVFRMRRAASVGLIVFALTGSLAGIDWLASANPEFHSSIYGLLFLTFQLLAGYAFGLFVLLKTHPPHPERIRGYAALLISVLLLWAYNHAMQYIIVWSGNIPEEALWYAKRNEGGWFWVLWALVTFQFLVPFLALLSSDLRASRLALLWIAGATLALRFVEAILLVLPDLPARGGILVLNIPATVLFAAAAGFIAFMYVQGRLESRRDIQGNARERARQSA
jgi:hypothetical protein